MEILKNILSLIVLVSAAGIWYFIKKRPNTKYRNISIAVLISCIFVIGIFFKENKTKTESTKPATTQVASSSSSESTENTKEEKTSEKTSETSTTQEIKNDGPKYTEASNTEFATHLTTEINNQLANTGYQVVAKPVGKNVLYLYLPQEAKYYSKVEIQQIADNLYQIKESTFKNWAIENGYDLGSTYSPKLYVKVEDDTTIAEESGALKKSMKVKVNN
ncbi:DUF3290 family protein [uncultured Streptococcus sp.]|uniref:DUF3290 family protein n=1 Tax=uncultured Streptococcus sp. TaxID=83427 RepID=UPI0028EAEEE4|nr:DUF3290 family protein [uncultured Streptococcus sp.]